MAIIFKYKNPLNVSYAPGFVSGGTDGRQGDKGETGNALYFVDYELDNSYNIELALQKIENGYILSSANTEKLDIYRKYKVNDLLLTPTGKCYRLIFAPASSTFKNYKYNIEYLGSIKKKTNPSPIKVVFTDITSMDDATSPYYYIQKSPFPTNRSTTDESDIIHTVNNVTPTYKMYPAESADTYKMRGKWYEITIIGTCSSIDAFYTTDRNIGEDESEKELIKELVKKIDTSAISPCRYSLQLHLKNHKKYCLDFAPDDTNSQDNAVTDFYKVLEFNKLNMKIDDSIYKSMTIEQKEEDDKISQYLDHYKTIVYISDFMLDRYHLFGNNIQCTIDNDKKMWYKTGLYAEDNLFTVNDFSIGPSVLKTNDISEETTDMSDSTSDEGGEEESPTDEKQYICEDTVKFYEQGCIFKETTKERTTEQEIQFTEKHPTVEGFPKYSMGISSKGDPCGNSLILNDIVAKYVISHEANDSSNNILIKENVYNPSRSGDSAYFSSIIDDNICLNEIDKFLSNQENIAMVTSKNLSTNESLATEVPFEIVYKNS